MNLYVSNLAYALTDDELRNEFANFGVVSSARVVKDRESGRSRGFGFVEMPNDSEALAAIRALNNANVSGRPMKVVEARPKEARPQRDSGAGGGGGYRSEGGGGHRDRGDRGGGDRDWGGRRGGDRDWDRDRGGKGRYEDHE